MLVGFANHLWQSTLFVLAIALVVRLFRNDAARFRYALWLAASAKFLVPFSLLAAVGAALAPPPMSPIRTITAWPGTLERLAEPVQAEVIPPSATVALLAVWIAGALCVLLGAAFRARLLGAIVRDAAAAAEPGRVAAALPVRFSSTRLEPALVGVVRPVLLLPKDLEARLSPAQLDAVIAHELCHWRRRDNLTGALHIVVEALFWFYPLVWWIGSRLLHEREHACDEAVIAAGHDRRTYAEAILNVAELSVVSPVRCAAGVGGDDLKGRITAVMRRPAMKRLGRRKSALLNLGALSALAVPVVAGWIAAATAEAQVEEYLPIVKIAPYYPEEAAALRLEGYVIVEFTVTESGSVEDLLVVESSSPIFEPAALDAVSKFKYAPRLINGNPVAVPGVRNRITFVLENHDDLVHERGGDATPAAGNV